MPACQQPHEARSPAAGIVGDAMISRDESSDLSETSSTDGSITSGGDGNTSHSVSPPQARHVAARNGVSTEDSPNLGLGLAPADESDPTSTRYAMARSFSARRRQETLGATPVRRRSGTGRQPPPPPPPPPLPPPRRAPPAAAVPLHYGGIPPPPPSRRVPPAAAVNTPLPGDIFPALDGWNIRVLRGGGLGAVHGSRSSDANVVGNASTFHPGGAGNNYGATGDSNVIGNGNARTLRPSGVLRRRGLGNAQQRSAARSAALAAFTANGGVFESVGVGRGAARNRVDASIAPPASSGSPAAAGAGSAVVGRSPPRGRAAAGGGGRANGGVASSGGQAPATAGSGEGAGGGETNGAGSRSAISMRIHQLHKASVVGDLAAISRFIRDGGNLEAQSFCGRTALHYAAFYGHAEVARALILGGANVCSRGGGNSTPLHFAAWGGNKPVVRLLLDYGADVEARDTEGNAAQAYSEDEELYEMLARARRRLLPMPTAALANAVEKRPIAALAAYTAMLVIVFFAAGTLAVSSATISAAADTASSASAFVGVGLIRSAAAGAATASGLASPHQWFPSVGGIGGGRVVNAAAAAAAVTGAGGDGGGVVPSVVFWTALSAALLLGLAPAACFAVGFKRRTEAFWTSVKDRDAEIVRICHEQQASQGGLSALAAAAAAAATASNTTNSHNSGAAATAAGRVVSPAAMDASPTASGGGTISRGELAGQAVLARLARLEAGGRSAAIGDTVGGGGPGGVGPLTGQNALSAQQLQVQVRRYQQALLAVGGGSGAGGRAGGGGGGRGARPCVQVAQ